MKKIPMRTCVVTREVLPKQELIRIVSTENGVMIDPNGKLNGRGVYLKRDIEVFKKAKSKKVLNRVLKTEVPESFFEELNKKI
jgi:predicted RNA-binding protein YlxR (DUF448 family)